MDRKRLANYKHETAELHDQFKTAVHAGTLPSAVSRQLAELARRYPSLSFDPATGIGKLDTDVLFDSGQAELKPAAQAMLAELSRVLQRQEAGDLKVMVVGPHGQPAAGGQGGAGAVPRNFHLSTARALAVADQLRRQGLSERRIGVAGFGPYQPAAPNASPASGRRIAGSRSSSWPRDVPVVGWTDSSPSVY